MNSLEAQEHEYVLPLCPPRSHSGILPLLGPASSCSDWAWRTLLVASAVLRFMGQTAPDSALRSVASARTEVWERLGKRCPPLLLAGTAWSVSVFLST
eukprot:520848-Hanusia_phi.AAC.4